MTTSLVDPAPADPTLLPSSGVSFADLIAQEAVASMLTLYPELRAEGRVISPKSSHPNIHD